MRQAKNHAFPKSKRLLKPRDFQNAFDSIGCKQGGKLCTMLAAPNQLTISRIGLIVAKKNLKHATKRNQFKRHTRETFRLQSQRFDKLPRGFDIIVLAKSSANNVNTAMLRRELEQQWSKLIIKLQNHSKPESRAN